MKQILLVLTVVLCAVSSLFAQRTITGTVTDDSGETLIGATILEDQTSNGVTTDIDGTFSITVSEGAKELIFSYTGYATKREPIGASNVMNIVLTTDAVGLEELIVIGYSPQKRKDVTGAVSSVNTENIADIPIPSFEVALQGSAAGVSVNKNSGKPGGGVDVNIRGRTSVLASNQPLYIVDGVPVISGDNFDFAQEGIGGSNVSVISDLNPDEIASIEVLKDASSAAIYGSRAANGVVLITTKKGKAGKTKITLNSSYGQSWLPAQIETISGDQYQEYSVELWGPLLDQIGVEKSWQSIQDNILGPVGNASTNWQDEIFRSAPTQDHSITVSGGNEKTKFFTSLGYSDQLGIIKNTGYDRFSARLNLENIISDHLSFGMNLGYTRSNTQQVQNDNNIYGALGAAILIPPVVPIYNEDGSYGGAFGIENAVAAVTEYQNNIIRGKLLGNVYGKWNITQDLSFRASLGVDIINSNERIYEPRVLQSSNTGRAVVATISDERIINEYVLNYNKSFDKNSFQALVGYSYQQDNINTSYSEAVDFPTDDFTGLTSGASPLTTNGLFTADILNSYFGSVNYNYDSKYYVTGTFRADGSSRFINNQWGYFPGVSAGWNISSENFLEDGPFDLLKLRVGWGKTGNNVISNFTTRQLFAGGRNYDDVPGIAPSQIGNPDLKWETTSQTNIGLDFGIINNKITGSLDFYIKNTEDLLLNRPIPTTSGFTSVIQNIGEVRNTGIDLTINSTNIQRSDFTWNSTFTIGWLENEVVKLVNGVPIDAGFANRIAEGQPLGSFYGHQTDGIFQNQAEIDAHATQTTGTAPGDLRFADIGGGAGPDGILNTADDLAPDGIINDDDRTFIGKAIPDFTGGLRNTLSFKGFDLNFFFQFAVGNQVYNNNLAFAEGMNSVFSPTVRAWENRWKQEGDQTDIPRLIRNDPNSNRRDSDRLVEDGDYIRLKSLSFGYTIPSSVIDKVGISKIRVYVSGYNLWTATKYSWYDPEVNIFDGNNTALGTDFLTFPQPRSLVFGVNIGF